MAAPISELFTTEEVKQSCCHIKMQCGDYFTYLKKSNQPGGSPHCRVCRDKDAVEDILQIMIQCGASSEIRKKKLDDQNIL